ncbi:MAG TPA: ribulokinase [Thermoanaerobaculia bacterium]|nr:ribulokinase [Thermoanaerobaculia bacterium]
MTEPQAPCALGLDFGTASVRALVVETRTGKERGSAVVDYRHGVIESALPGSSAKLPADWALQHPGDWVEAIERAVPEALRSAGVPAASVVGVGVDFTSCTVLPVDAAGKPLCLDPRWASRPHAWVKLWKHHASQPQADRINALAAERREAFLPDYGGKTSSEWLVAKALQILDEDPEVYAAAASIVEGGDWIVGELCGARVRNACGAGYKGFWSRERGFPSAGFFAALDPRFRDLAGKLGGEIVPPGRAVGGLTPGMAERLGLAPGTAVAAAIIDAHSAVPAATVVEGGRLVMVIGTSTCHMLLADRHAAVQGVGGVVRDGIVEGFYGYEAGQPAVGDIFGWFAKLAGGGDFAKLEKEAAEAPPGARGLLALDWWNGNRSVLVDANLSGLLVGLTLQTTAAEIYRALIEATAFSTRRILDAFEAEKIPVRELIAVGGLAERSPLLLQIYADVTRRPIALAATANASALGAAMLGAVAAGVARGGHASFVDAARAMAHLKPQRIAPDPKAAAAYDALYRDWLALHDHFGHGPGAALMARLRRGRA